MEKRKRAIQILVPFLLMFILSINSNAAEPACLRRIMPLGDSITAGDGEITDQSYMSGYRRPLYLSLRDNGFQINFVGSLQNGNLATPAFDYDHEGWGGYRDDQTAQLVYGFLKDNPADFILLHIGTNGINPDPSDVENILNEIDRYESDYNRPITVLLARIINRKEYSPETTRFNNNVEAMAAARIAAGDRILMVDMESALNYSIHMWDNLHPNELGYARMAEVWFPALEEVLPPCVPDLSISPASHNFGNVQVNGTSTKMFNITNAGGADLMIGNLSVNMAEFALRNDLCSGKTIPYSGTCTFDIVFSPSREGIVNGTLLVPSNDPDSPLNVSLSGAGYLLAGNNLPSKPQLKSPVEGEVLQGTDVTLKWQNSSDPDGDTVGYHVYCCKDENFIGCTPMAAVNPSGGRPLYAGIGTAGILLALFGSITGRRRKKLILVIGVLLALGSLLVSCGGGGGGDEGTGESTYNVLNLQSGTTYYWKVGADDGNGGVNVSDKRSFETR